MSASNKIIQAAAGNAGGLPNGVASFQLTTDVVERGLEVATNGSCFYVPDYRSGGDFHVYEMSTPFDVTTAVRNTDLEFPYPSSGYPIDIAVTHDGYKAVGHQFSSSTPFKKWTTTTPYDFSSVTPTNIGSSSLSNGIISDATETNFFVTRDTVVRRYAWSSGGSNSSVSGTYSHYHSTWADNGYLYIAAPNPDANTIHYTQPLSAYGLDLAGSYTSVALLPDTSLDFNALSYTEGGEMLFVLDRSTSPATVYTFTRAYLESKGVPFTQSLSTDPHWSMLNHDYYALNSINRVVVNNTDYTGTSITRDKVVSVFENSTFQDSANTTNPSYYSFYFGSNSGDSVSIKYNAPNATTATLRYQRYSGTDVNFTLSGDVSGSGTATSSSQTTTVACPPSGVITVTANNSSTYGMGIYAISFNNYTAGDFDYD